MSSIPQKTDNGNDVSDFATKFLKRFHIETLLFKCNAGKEKGVPVMDIFRYLLFLVFADRSMYMQMKTVSFEGGFCKNTVYRFLNSVKTNWQRFTTLLSAEIIHDFMKPLTSDDRKDVFIIDDSLFDRSRSKKTELLANVFDHCSMKYKRGFRILTLGWSDGNSFVPINHCLLYSRNKKRWGRSRYLLSMEAEMEKEGERIPVKLVFVRNKSNRKDWLVLVSTDTSLSKEESIRIYGKRWDIEVFFKSCKSYLKLVKECRSTSYDALNAHTAIVFTRYMMLSVAQRENEDDKTICELCFCLMDEMEDITFSRFMGIILDALMEAVMEYFHITETQREEFTTSFIQRLPKYMQDALIYGNSVV